MYGADASGKSNLYFGLQYFQNIIKESMNNVGVDELTTIDKHYVPFSFYQDTKPAEFQIILLVDNFFKNNILLKRII